MNIGMVLTRQRKFDEAASFHRRALALDPNHADAHLNLARALAGREEHAAAIPHYERASVLKPGAPEIKFELCMAQLRVLYADESEIAAQRRAYETQLRALSEEVNRKGTLSQLFDSVGGCHPFYLPYQGYNDRELQELYGSLVCAIMAERYPQTALVQPPQSGEPIRVGFVSGFFLATHDMEAHAPRLAERARS